MIDKKLYVFLEKLTVTVEGLADKIQAQQLQIDQLKRIMQPKPVDLVATNRADYEINFNKITTIFDQDLL